MLRPINFDIELTQNNFNQVEVNQGDDLFFDLFIYNNGEPVALSGQSVSAKITNNGVFTLYGEDKMSKTGNELKITCKDGCEMPGDAALNITFSDSNGICGIYEIGIRVIEDKSVAAVTQKSTITLIKSLNDATAAANTAIANGNTTQMRTDINTNITNIATNASNISKNTTDISKKQEKTDNSLNTTSKTIVGAINEVKSEADSNTSSISSINGILGTSGLSGQTVVAAVTALLSFKGGFVSDHDTTNGKYCWKFDNGLMVQAGWKKELGLNFTGVADVNGVYNVDDRSMYFKNEFYDANVVVISNAAGTSYYHSMVASITKSSCTLRIWAPVYIASGDITYMYIAVGRWK